MSHEDHEHNLEKIMSQSMDLEMNIISTLLKNLTI